MNKSFLKLTQTNNKILDDLVPLIKSFKKSNINQTYIEPFLGSGVVFLNIDNFENYILNDLNVDIFMLFSQIKNNYQMLNNDTKKLFNETNRSQENFHMLIERYNKSNNYYERCKLFIYLNRHSVSSQLNFNPSGKYNTYFKDKSPYFPENEIILMNKTLNSKNVSLFNYSYEKIFDNLEYGDVVYCDPPEIGNGHLGFNFEDYRKLVKLSMINYLQGAKIIISGEYNELTKELYKDCSEYYIKKIKTNKKNKEEIIAIYA